MHICQEISKRRDKDSRETAQSLAWHLREPYKSYVLAARGKKKS